MAQARAAPGPLQAGGRRDAGPEPHGAIPGKQPPGGQAGHRRLPHSLWETYSAFANSYGGVILLGVEELPDHSLRVQGLLEPHEMADELWSMLSDPKVVSANILRRDQVWVAGTDYGSVVVVEVPPAERDQLPVYLGGDPFTGSYRRAGTATTTAPGRGGGHAGRQRALKDEHPPGAACAAPGGCFWALYRLASSTWV
jgi:hypothetical protein